MCKNGTFAIERTEGRRRIKPDASMARHRGDDRDLEWRTSQHHLDDITSMGHYFSVFFFYNPVIWGLKFGPSNKFRCSSRSIHVHDTVAKLIRIGCNGESNTTVLERSFFPGCGFSSTCFYATRMSVRYALSFMILGSYRIAYGYCGDTWLPTQWSWAPSP